MAFTEAEKSLIKEIANEVGEVIAKRFIELHIATCPTSETVKKWKWIATGMGACGIMIGSFGTVKILEILKLLN